MTDLPSLPTSTPAAALALASILSSFGLCWFKRKFSPTNEEKHSDTEREIQAIQQDILDARARGDDALAESLRRRLLNLKGYEAGGGGSDR